MLTAQVRAQVEGFSSSSSCEILAWNGYLQCSLLVLSVWSLLDEFK